MRWRTEAEQEIPAPSAVFHRARSKRFLNLLRGAWGISPTPQGNPAGFALGFLPPSPSSLGLLGFWAPGTAPPVPAL